MTATTLSATIFDTNTYLKASQIVFDEILVHENIKGITPYVDPWVAMELVAHLNDPNHKQYRPAKAAIKRMVQHAASVGNRSLKDAILVDSEEQVALLLFNRRLPGHRQSLAALAMACNYVASVEVDAPLNDIEPIIREIAKHVVTVDLLIRPIRPDAETWDAISQDSNLRAHASTFLRSEQALTLQATSEVLRAYDEAGLDRPAEVPAIQVQAVLSKFRFALELQNSFLCGVIERGWSLDKPGRRNWIWDVLIAYNVGQSVGQHPLRLITSDKHFHEVALRTGHGGLAMRLEDYRRALLVNQAEQNAPPPDCGSPSA